jgi:C4-dicarboxylate-specific signal transduction histidine kinase
VTALAERTAAEQPEAPAPADTSVFEAEAASLREYVASLEARVRQGEDRRRAMIHIMDDLRETNRRLSDQRRAMLHILVDYEADRRRLAQQRERLDGSRRALLHILQDSHESNLRLERSRKAMIHIMGDLRDTTEAVEGRERELREKQEQVVQAGKLATLGELTTGVAHELNNPLNNIGLYLGNIGDQVAMRQFDPERVLAELEKAQRQVGKATEIISHLRTFGRVAVASREVLDLSEVMRRAISLIHEQLRLRQIEIQVSDESADAVILGNPIQIEQAFINLLTNARDAISEAAVKRIWIEISREGEMLVVRVRDSGEGIPPELEGRIFDPFVTTKDVGHGTGLGLSITYGIIKDHGGEISVENVPPWGAEFTVLLPVYPPEGVGDD